MAQSHGQHAKPWTLDTFGADMATALAEPSATREARYDKLAMIWANGSDHSSSDADILGRDLIGIAAVTHGSLLALDLAFEALKATDASTRTAKMSACETLVTRVKTLGAQVKQGKTSLARTWWWTWQCATAELACFGLTAAVRRCSAGPTKRKL